MMREDIYRELVMLGRNLATSSAKRGALIQFEGKVAYMTNSHYSIAIKFDLLDEIGEGTIYSDEAVLDAKRIERRDGKVLFEINDKRIFVPEKKPIADKVEEVIKKYYQEPSLDLPVSAIQELDKDILVTRFLVEDGILYLSQRRADGSVDIQRKICKYDGELTEVPIFTQDISIFTRANNIKISLDDNHPVSLKARYHWGHATAVIAHMVYEL